MQVSTKGIILRQTKTVNDMRMLTLFSEQFGKISVAAKNDNFRGKLKSSLAIRPFTLGRYELYKNRDSYRLGRSETVRSFFGIGENIDRYMEASFVLEFTDKILEENAPAPAIFQLMTDYFDALERRSKEMSFLTTVYQIKAVQILGYSPRLNECSHCGKREGDFMFHVESGGAVCPDCARDNGLIFKSDSDIIDKIKFISRSSMKELEKLYLEKQALDEMNLLIRRYTRYHLDIPDLKSETLLLEK
ncbi:MAG: DNA repair protein RecO [Firmicutes bacterium]|nr:DNA repair protein RecO [Bacillota bacterium]